MPLKMGDKVIYIYNMPFDNNSKLLKRLIGTIDEFWESFRSGSMVGCVWEDTNGEVFHWNVPKRYVKLYKENK